MRGTGAWCARVLAGSLAIAALSAVVGCRAPAPAEVSSPTDPVVATAAAIPASTTDLPPPPAASPTPAPVDVEAPFVEARVVEVVDGDTIRAAVGDEVYRIRYIGIDAPEVDSPDERLKQLAAEATAVNAGLVGGKTVLLERDVSETDAFGRLLRYVWVGDKMVNAELVRLGYASAVAYNPDVKHQTVLSELGQRAQAAHRILWSSAQPIALENTSLRSGPGTQHEKAGSVKAGETLEIVARNEAGDWVQLAGGAWMLARLVINPPGGAPVADGVRAQPVEPVTPAPTAAPGNGSIAIVDLFRDGASGPAEPDEYVEIRNLGSVPQEMTGWRLESERRQNDAGQVFTFPDGFVMQPGQTCRIYTNEDHPESCGLSFRHPGTAIWSNSQPDAALLFDDAGVLVSERP